MPNDIAQAIDAVDNADDPSIFVSANGIKFKLKKFAKLAIAEGGRRIKMPKPPVMWIEEKGRNEENPTDPDYLDAVREAEYKRSMVAIGIGLANGTEVISIPSNINKPEETEWSDDLALLDIEVPVKGKARYVDWIRLYALDDDDFNALVAKTLKFAGLTSEEDVKAKADSFQG